jgi:hypothetical protein
MNTKEIYTAVGLTVAAILFSVAGILYYSLHNDTSRSKIVFGIFEGLGAVCVILSLVMHIVLRD